MNIIILLSDMYNAMFVKDSDAFLSTDDVVTELRSWFCGPKLNIYNMYNELDSIFGISRTIENEKEGWRGWKVKSTEEEIPKNFQINL